MIEIVVSKYKENVDWISSVPFNCMVYNKFQGDNLLPNVGRESHTYLTHIVRNYENLSEFTLFVQGDPIAHCRDFMRLMNDPQFLEMKYQYIGLSDGMIKCDGNGRPHCGKEHLPISKLYEYLFGEKSPETFVSNPAGQFRVSRDVIRRNSKEFYERALKTLSYDVNPIEGFCMERMWPALFGFKSSLNRSEIRYYGDSHIDIDDYLKSSTGSDGSFLPLGKLGFMGSDV